MKKPSPYDLTVIIEGERKPSRLTYNPKEVDPYTISRKVNERMKANSKELERVRKK